MHQLSRHLLRFLLASALFAALATPGSRAAGWVSDPAPIDSGNDPAHNRSRPGRLTLAVVA